MKHTLGIMAGAALILLFATLMLVIMPYVQLNAGPAPDGLEPYSQAALRGRQIYISEGCSYCHSQQPRDPGFTASDAARGWGRASAPGDYVFDNPHLMGTMRTGPDLFNIGARQPSDDWHLVHLYDPRAVSPDSTMPAYRYLFAVVPQAHESDRTVPVPERFVKGGEEVVATQAALDLVEYLKALDHTYPTDELPEAIAEEGSE